MIARRLLITGACLLIVVASLVVLPDRAVFWSPDEGGKYLDLLQISSSDRWTHALPYPGRRLDPDLEQVPLLYYYQRDHELHSWWPSWFPRLSVPFYHLFGARGVFVVPLLSGILTCALVGYASSDISGKVTAPWLIMVGSPILFYSLTFWEHTLHTSLVLLALLIILHDREPPGARRYAIGGVLLGLALYLRLETILFVGAVGLVKIFVPVKRRASRDTLKQNLGGLLILVLCFTAMAIPYFALNYHDAAHILGRDFSSALTPNLIGTYPTAEHPRRAEFVPNLVVGTARHSGADLSPILRWLFVLAAFGSALWPWLSSRRLDGVAIAGVLTLVVLCSTLLFRETTYTSIHGLVLIAPWIVLAGWALRPEVDEATRRWGYLTAFSFLAFLGASFLRGWEGQGGLQWGPRYALPLYPLFGICVIRGTRRAFASLPRGSLTRIWLRGSLITLCVLGIGFEIRGLHLMHTSRQTYAHWQDEMMALPQDAILTTDLEWLALTLPEVYVTRPVYFASPSELLESSGRARAYEMGYRQICHIHHPTRVDIQMTCRPISDPSSG